MFRTILIGLFLLLAAISCGFAESPKFSTFRMVTPENETAFRNISSETVSDDNGTDFIKMLNVYDTTAIRRVWRRENRLLTEECRRDMKTFLTALDKSELWALKVVDASGRYTTGFFWGNNYWTGSETLCHNIGLKRRHYTSNGNLPDGKLHLIVENPSPIKLGFYKIKALLKPPETIAPVRTILVGLCSPYSCVDNDIRTILNMSAIGGRWNSSVSIRITDIRTPHDAFSFWQDPTFWIMTGVTSAVVVLLIIGTAYDYCRVRRYEKVNRSRIPFGDSYLSTESNRLNNSNKLANGIENAIERSVPKLDDNSNALDNIEESSVHSDSDHEIWQKVLVAFSVRENLRTICDKGVSVDTIPTIHGLRAISMAWVILGHTCIIIFKYSDNMEFRTIVEKDFFFQTVTNGAFSVDTFFFISGLLVSFLYFRTTAKIDITRLTGQNGLRSNVLQFLGLIAYRYGRLTAPYMFVLGCVQVIMKSFHHNSVFDTPTLDHENCPKYWWRNALYINTLFPVKEMCMLWSWYLADDTQFYILGIIILIVAFTHLKIAAALTLGFLVSSWATTAYVAYVNNHLPSQDDPLALFDKIYDKPWTRLGPYLIGMIVGWILFKTECKIQMRKVTVVFGWFITLLGLSSLVYGLYEMELDLVTSAAYSSLSHTAWALGLAWIVIACSTGNGGFITKLLSASVLYPFSRVTYCAYLIHPLVIRLMIINLDSPLHLNKEVVAFLFLGQVVVSYVLSFAVSIAFEAPVVSLLRIFSPTKTSRNLTR